MKRTTNKPAYRSPVRRWCHEHSLTIVMACVWAFLMACSVASYDDTVWRWMAERMGGHADDAFGAMLLILATKWLIEKGSAQSRQDDDEESGK